MSGSRLLRALAFLLVFAPLVGAVLIAFPQSDDGYLALLVKESGPDAIRASHPDRPLMGLLWSLVIPSFETLPIVGVLSQAILWPLLAFQAAIGWRKLFPGEQRFEIVAACLTVAPIAVQTQLVTVTLTLGALLSVVVGYTAILLLIRSVTGEASALHLAGGYILFVAAGLVTEYTVCVGLAGLVFLLVAARVQSDPARRARGMRIAAGLLAILVITYIVYRSTVETGARPNVDPASIVERAGGLLIRFPIALVSELFRVVVGAFAAALATHSVVSWGSKSTVVGAAYGVVTAAVLIMTCRTSATDSQSLRPSVSRQVVAILAVVAGLTPVLLMGREPGGAWTTRFVLPVLPVAAIVTLAGTLTLVRDQLWVVPIALLGFVCGSASASTSLAVVRKHYVMTAIGDALRPRVSANDQLVVAVLSEQCYRHWEAIGSWESSAQVTHDWPPELSRKLWVYLEPEAVKVFGSRLASGSAGLVDVDVRSVVRRGPVAELLWIEPRQGGGFIVEPYFSADQRREGSSRTGSNSLRSDGSRVAGSPSSQSCRYDTPSTRAAASLPGRASQPP